MSEQHTTDQALNDALSEDDLTLVVGGNTDPDDPPPGPPGKPGAS